jgi:hypothetical protein
MSEAPPAQLSRRRRWGWLFWVACWLVLLLGIGVLVDYSEAFTDCVHTRKDRDEYQALHERVGVVQPYIVRERARLRLVYACAGEFADKDNGAIVALATAVVALFTFTLWRSTQGLRRLGEGQSEDMQKLLTAARDNATAASEQAEAMRQLHAAVIGRCMQRHRHVEFIRFLNTVERAVAADKPIHVVLDNYATHKHPKVLALAFASSALDLSLHSDLGFLAQCGREFLLQDDPTAHPPRRLPLDR